MKRNLFILLIICFSVSIRAQKNYPLFSIEGVKTICFDSQEPHAFVLQENGNEFDLAEYDLNKGTKIQSFKSQMPENPAVFMVMGTLSSDLYLITVKEDADKNMSLLDAIYSFSTKQDRLERIFIADEEIQRPSSVELNGTKLVMISSPFKEQPRVFDLEKRKFESFSSNPQMRFLCCSENGGFVVFKFDEVKDDDSVPVYVLDPNQKLSECVGTYSSRMVISSNEEENTMPGFTITNPDYNWIVDAYNKSGFPLSGFDIATRSELANKFNQLSNLFDISKVDAANDVYMAASGKGQMYIYNTKNPLTTKPQTVSDSDLKAIDRYFSDMITYTKNSIQSSGINEVFDAKFYGITERIQLDEYSYSESRYIAYSADGFFGVLKERNQLTKLVSGQFKLDSDEAAVHFQDALNALYPADTFAQKYVSFFNQDDRWCFVRDESFGEKKGFVVLLNSDTTIKEIDYSEKL